MNEEQRRRGRDWEARQDAETNRQSEKKSKRCEDDRRGDDDCRWLSRRVFAEDGNSKEKYIEIVDRGSRNKDRRQREEVGREKRCLEGDYREENSSRDCSGNEYGVKCVRDEIEVLESSHNKLRVRSSSNSSDEDCLVNIDAWTSDEDDNEKMGGDKTEDESETRSQCVNEQHLDAEKKKGRLEEGSYRDKYENIVDGDIAYNGRKQRGDVVREMRCGGGKQGGYMYDSKHARAEIGTGEGSHQKVWTCWDGNFDDCLINIDRYTPDDDDKGKMGSGSKEGQSHRGSQVANEQHSTVEKQLVIDKKAELLTDRILDVHTTPVEDDISASSKDVDCKCLNRAVVGQTSRIEKFGQASGTMDGGDLSDDGFRLSQETPLSTAADGERISASSSRANGLVRSCRSSTQTFRFRCDAGSSNQNNRGISNQRYQRSGDLNVGRAQQDAGKDASNWYAPVMYSFIPFQHSPPPAGYNLMMRHFSVPPIFTFRHSADSKHFGVWYNAPNISSFSKHGQPHGFQNPFDVLQPLPSHGTFGGEAHIYGRHDLDNDRTLTSRTKMEANAVMCMGQSCDVRMELPSSVQNKDNSVTAPAVEEATCDLSKMARVCEARYWNVYFSRIDVSAYLTDPELYDKCMTLMGIEPNGTHDEGSSEFLQVEGGLKARLKISSNCSPASLSSAKNDSLFKKAMSFYKKQRKETWTVLLPFLGDWEKPALCMENLESVLLSDPEKKVPFQFAARITQGDLSRFLMGMTYEVWFYVPRSNQRCQFSCMKWKYLETLAEMAEEPVPLGSLEVPENLYMEKMSVSSFTHKVSTMEQISCHAAKEPICSSCCSDDHSIDSLDATKCADLPFSDNKRVTSDSSTLLLSFLIHSFDIRNPIHCSIFISLVL